MLACKSSEALDRMTDEVIEGIRARFGLYYDFPERQAFTRVIRGGFVAMQQLPTDDCFEAQRRVAFATANIIHELEPLFNIDSMRLYTRMMEQVRKW